MKNNFSFKKDIDKFISTISRGHFKKHINTSLNQSTDLQIYVDAIYQGYLDACRTFKKNEKKLSQDSCVLNDLAKELRKYLTIENVEFAHEQYCNDLISSTGMTFGHAQKIVNMAFKYLSCLPGAYEYSDKFAKCHMPLDSIMLEWLVREWNAKAGKSKIVKSEMSSWSSMGPDEYYSYVEMIDDIKNEKMPLQLDFENWRKMQLRLSAESFLKTLYESTNMQNYSKDLKNKSYGELITEVKRQICQAELEGLKR